MGFVKGGLGAVGLIQEDGSNSVTSDNISDDLEYSEETQTVTLADGQEANASDLSQVTFAAYDLTSADRTQLNTWEDGDTKVTALFEGVAYTVAWLDPSYIQVDHMTAGRGDLHHTEITLSVER